MLVLPLETGRKPITTFVFVDINYHLSLNRLFTITTTTTAFISKEKHIQYQCQYNMWSSNSKTVINDLLGANHFYYAQSFIVVGDIVLQFERIADYNCMWVIGV